MQIKKIILFKIKKPEKNINKELQFLANSLGLFSLRDKEKSLFRVFVELVKSTKEGKIISSDELAYQLHLTRGTVVHHLNKLIMANIAKRESKGYKLKKDTLKEVVQNIKRETCEILDELEATAKYLDSRI